MVSKVNNLEESEINKNEIDKNSKDKHGTNGETSPNDNERKVPFLNKILGLEDSVVDLNSCFMLSFVLLAITFIIDNFAR